MDGISDDPRRGSGGNHLGPADEQLLTQLTKHSVLLGRGTGPNEHYGNRYFRIFVSQQHDQYFNANTSEAEKDFIVSSIISHVEERGGSFVRKLSKHEVKQIVSKNKVASVPGAAYVKVDRIVVVDKIKQALRYAAKGKREVGATNAHVDDEDLMIIGRAVRDKFPPRKRPRRAEGAATPRTTTSSSSSIEICTTTATGEGRNNSTSRPDSEEANQLSSTSLQAHEERKSRYHTETDRRILQLLGQSLPVTPSLQLINNALQQQATALTTSSNPTNLLGLPAALPPVSLSIPSLSSLPLWATTPPLPPPNLGFGGSYASGLLGQLLLDPSLQHQEAPQQETSSVPPNLVPSVIAGAALPSLSRLAMNVNSTSSNELQLSLLAAIAAATSPTPAPTRSINNPGLPISAPAGLPLLSEAASPDTSATMPSSLLGAADQERQRREALVVALSTIIAANAANNSQQRTSS